MATVWKVIKPSRLKDQAMRLELLNAMARMGTKIKRDFDKTVETWDHRPKFEVLRSLAGGNITVVVDTNDPAYGYVSRGTQPHAIFPVRSKSLRFPSTYSPKTVPGVIDSKSGGGSGDLVHSMYVDHPGNEPRNFHKVIGEKWQKQFRAEMEDAMRRARTVSGHAK